MARLGVCQDRRLSWQRLGVAGAGGHGYGVIVVHRQNWC
jgi:hypothetical protein